MLAGPPATDMGRRGRPGVRWDPRRVAMPFAYKLAYRLARLKHRTLAGAAAAVAAAVVLSCELPVATPNATVSQLIIIPHTVTLQLNQDQDFVAVGLSAAGDTTPSTVSWNVTGGTITDMGSSNGRHYGQYHSGTCGSFKVAATSHPDRTSDTATVTVAGCVAPVAAVTVSPAAPTVPVGQTAQLTATPQDASGNPLTGRVITWQSSNGAGADGPIRHRRQRAGDGEHLGAEHRATAGGPGQRDAAERHRDAAGGRAGRGGFWAGAEHDGRRRRRDPLPRPVCGGPERLGSAGLSREDRAYGAGGRGDGHPGLRERAARADGAAHGHAPGRERQSVDRPGHHLAVEQ